MPISWRRENDGFIMTHNRKTETFSQKIEYSGGAMFLPLTPLFSFVTFHLKVKETWKYRINLCSHDNINLYCPSLIVLSITQHK